MHGVEVMPRLAFRCPVCGHAFELTVSRDEADELMEAECPACGSPDATRAYDEETVVEDEEAGDVPDLESEPDDEPFDLDLGVGDDEEN
jgi:putative FmdB family regulatory protein